MTIVIIHIFDMMTLAVYVLLLSVVDDSGCLCVGFECSVR